MMMFKFHVPVKTQRAMAVGFSALLGQPNDEARSGLSGRCAKNEYHTTKEEDNQNQER